MNRLKNFLGNYPMRPATNRAIVFSFLLILLSPWSGWGATYYMRADGGAANKAAATSCSSASTAMSVATHNAQTFSPDDVIYLCSNGGDFKSSIVAPSSGTSGHPITYTNAVGHSPIIDLSVSISTSGWASEGGGIYSKAGVTQVRFMTEDETPIKNASTKNCSNGNWYQGYDPGPYTTYYKPTSGVPTDHSLRGIYISNYGDPNPGGLDLRNRSYITVYGLNFRRSSAGVVHGQNILSPTSTVSNIIIHDNTFTNIFWAIWSNINIGQETDVQIYNNTIDYCNSGISAWTNSGSPANGQKHIRHSITNNTITHHWSYTDSKFWNDGLQNSYWSTDHEAISFQDVQDSTITGNTIIANFSKSFTTDEYFCRAFYIFVTNGGAPTSGNMIARNYVEGHFLPAMYISGYGNGGFQNNTFAYNIFNYGGAYADHMSFDIYTAQPNPLTGMNYFVNNTMRQTAGIGFYLAAANVGNWTVANNIFLMNNFVQVSDNNNTGGLTFRNNIYAGAVWGFQIGGGAMPWTTWKSKGYDTVGSSTAAPLFTNGSGKYSLPSDFTPRADSPAINAGTNVGLTTDYAGKPIVGNPDIGAYEFQNVLQSPKGLKIVQ